MALEPQEWQAIIEAIGAVVQRSLAERQTPVGVDGTVIGGSWDPATGTALVIRADTASIIPNGYDQAAYATRVPIHTASYCQQYGVVGNERVVLYETQSGPAAILKFDSDDSIGAPAGEHWVAHRSAAGSFDVTSKWGTDGAATGDGLGSLKHVGGAVHLTQTKNGLSTRHDDTTQQIKHTAAAGLYTLLDAAGNAISHVGNVAVGDLYSNLTSATNAAARATDFVAYETSRQNANLQDVIKNAQLLNTVGAITGAQLTTMLAALVAGWAHSITPPACSTKVLIK